MQITWTRMPLKLAGPFRTAAATRRDKETLWVRIAHDDVTGWGEAAPTDTYHQTLESAEHTLATAAPFLDGSPLCVEHHVATLLSRFDDQRATVAAIDAAMHDWIGKRFEVPVVQWLGLSADAIPLTSLTIGMDEPAVVAEKLRQAEDYPIIKVKLGGPGDEKTLNIIRERAPRKTIRVDGNMAWSVDEAMKKLVLCAAHGVEFVEQPIAANDYAGLRRLKEAAICPIVADESCVRPADVVALAGCVDGINIKLSKCGGIREAIKMIHLARGLGMKVMLGCMIESSLGIAAAAQLAPLADWLDLDGHLLLAADPFTGLGGHGGRLRIGATPGLGVRPTAHAPA